MIYAPYHTRLTVSLGIWKLFSAENSQTYADHLESEIGLIETREIITINEFIRRFG